jgi:hypothetical protein
MQQSRDPGGNEALLAQRFPVSPYTDYTATCWIRADPALGLGSDSPGLYIVRTDVVCPVSVCDDDGDEDIDHAVGVAVVPFSIQSADWTPVTANFNSGSATRLALSTYSVLTGAQFILVDDCSVNQVLPPSGP